MYPYKWREEVSFRVYYLRSQLEKQAKDMIRILKKIYANKSTASWRYSAVSVAKKIISGRPQVAHTQNRISISGRGEQRSPAVLHIKQWVHNFIFMTLSASILQGRGHFHTFPLPPFRQHICSAILLV